MKGELSELEFELKRLLTPKPSKRKRKGKGKTKRPEEPRRSTKSELAYGFDYDISTSKKVKSRWGDKYNIALYGRLGLHCYNFQKGTNYRFVRWQKYSTALTADVDYYITLEAMDPARPKTVFGHCDSVFSFQTMLSDAGRTDGIYITWTTLAARGKCKEALDDEFDEDTIDDFYKSGVLKWLSDEAMAGDNKKYYVVQESELRENDWLQLFMEIGFFSKAKRRLGASPPLEIKKVVIETNEEYITEAREKLKAKNAIYYISYKYIGDPSSVWAGDHKSILRKTMDGKPGHMCLEVADDEE
ncbi:unnamed protein product [Arabis nemorensis]|uniref:Uncharacterized protein n=1 Tax=Arabis nemorensis TaxID=586526 RepID=A0A565CB06_9BRAS|nr:unnamed protein product [Arabis nemorensis]